MTLSWGHQFPIDSFLREDAVEGLRIIEPDGKDLKIAFSSEVELNSEESLTETGTYIVAAQRKAGFYTKTTHGGKAAPKKDLEGAIRCSYSQMCMKAIVNVGPAGTADTVVGQPIEIIPLKNPGTLKVGDYLPIRVVVDGKPFSGEVLATYAGFSMDKNTFAYATTTDKAGNARIRMLHAGSWIIKVVHEVPYPDETMCDVQAMIGTLTFGIE